MARDVQKASGLMVEVDWERRRLLKGIGGLVGVLVLLGISPQWAPTKAKTRRSWHLLQSIAVRETNELTGAEKDLILQKAMQATDVTSVLQEFNGKLSLGDAVVVRHTLDIRPSDESIRLLGEKNSTRADAGVHLLTVVIPQNGAESEGALIYREVDKPLAKRGKRGDAWRYKSEAMAIVRKGEVAELVAASVNGRLIYPKAPFQQGEPGLEQNCGGCVDPLWGPWEYDSANCTSWNWNCLIGCGTGCGVCGIQCAECLATGNPWACGKCIACALACGWCADRCCQHWQPTCTYCGTPP